MFIQTESDAQSRHVEILPGGPVLENGSRDIPSAEDAKVAARQRAFRITASAACSSVPISSR